ncbi:MAG: hypothetical protein HY077_12250 [Elusimicrobia bacterium]|nr:hypothetical protein [Elusimicrobiota bacterium]
MKRLSSHFLRLAENRVASAACVAAIPFSVGLVIFALKGAPHPTIHDEFSYLYAADTFAHGRLANPAHPFWRHFESFDILSRPTMSSRKPPGQGLFLALGQLLTGKPIAGVLLGVACAAAAIYWMLLAFVDPPWALLVGLLAATHPLIFSWTVSYWGGGVALLGGALAVGAWRRLMDKPRPWEGAVFGAGLVILANTRPFEGFALGASLGALLLWDQRRAWKRFAPASAAVLAAGACAMAYYNHRVTGDALLPPYVAYERAYNPEPLFVWQKPGPPGTYETKEFDEYWNHWERDAFRREDTWPGYRAVVLEKWARLSEAWLQPPPVLLFFASALCLASPVLAWLLMALVLAVTLPVRATTFAYFSAPLGGLFFAVLALVLRRLDGLRWRGRAAGRWLVVLTAAWALASSLGHYWAYARLDNYTWSVIKEEARGRMLGFPGRQLVLVRYAADHSVHQEWVYNEADMELSPVIWARSLTPEQDKALAGYYTDRNVWILEVSAARTRFKLNRAALTGRRP